MADPAYPTVMHPIEPGCSRCPSLVSDRTTIAWGTGPTDAELMDAPDFTPVISKHLERAARYSASEYRYAIAETVVLCLAERSNVLTPGDRFDKYARGLYLL
ncbi:hypothetical protein HUB97_03005 [Halorubraceae archaeon YAN]|nr:hypothetical protein [Halorubraceae archaeon YAN]